MSVNICLDNIFWTAEYFVAELGMVTQHHEPVCCAEKKKVWYCQGQCYSEDVYDQNLTLSTISSELLISWQPNSKNSKGYWMFVHVIPSELLNLLQPNLVWWCIIVSQIVFQKDWFVVFKVMVTVTVRDRIIKHIAIHATYFYPSGPFTCIFLKPLLIFPALVVAIIRFLCRPAW